MELPIMDQDPEDSTSRGWRPPLLINYTVIVSATVWFTDKCAQVPEAVFYTTIGLIEQVFEG